MGTDKSLPTPQDMQVAAAVYERHKGMMLKAALDYGGDSSLAEDIVSDAVLRLAEYAYRLRDMNDAERARYARLTVRSVAVDYRRRARQERRCASGEGAVPEDLPSDMLMEEELAERDAQSRRLGYLREALDELKPAEREALVGTYLYGESASALAKRLGLRPGSVRSLLTRARRKARRIVEGKEGGHG